MTQYQRLGLCCLPTSLSKAYTCGKPWLFTIYIYMGEVKQIGSRFGQGAKFRTGNFLPEIEFTICTSQFHSSQKGCESLKLTSIKDGFEELEHESSFGTFRQEKQDYHFRPFLSPGKFPMKRPEKSYPGRKVYNDLIDL